MMGRIRTYLKYRIGRLTNLGNPLGFEFVALVTFAMWMYFRTDALLFLVLFFGLVGIFYRDFISHYPKAKEMERKERLKKLKDKR